MADIDKGPLKIVSPDIQIIRLNTDKTRRTIGSYTVYQVYFELSASPPSAWRDIFGREWKDLNPQQEACVDGGFLVMHCPLQEVATIHLPLLKKAVRATNVAYKQYARELLTQEEDQAEARKKEQQIVEDLGKSLRFD
jgi:hypothetical protein